MAETKALFTQRFDAARAALTVGDEHAAAESLHSAVAAARVDPSLRPELASALFQLGKLSRKSGRAGEPEAEAFLTEALLISERLYGREDRALAPLLNELSRLHIQRSQYASAEDALKRLLAIARTEGEENADVATALAGLAAVKRKLGDEASAESLYRDALRIRVKVLEPNNMVTVVTLEQLSETCAERGKFVEALALLQRALSTREAVLGPGHASVEVARSRVAALELRFADDSRYTVAPTQADSREPAYKKRAAVYSYAGATAVAMAIAGLLMLRPRASGGSDPGSVQVGAAQDTTLASLAVATVPATVTGSSAAPRPIAPVVQPKHRASEVASPNRLPTVDVQLSSIDVPKTTLPTISAAASLESIAVSATARPRGSDTDRTGARGRGSSPKSADADEAIIPPKITGPVPQPRFPEALLRAGQREGEVVVRFTVSELGTVEVASMIVEQSDDELFTSAVRDILPRFHFEPARTRAPESKPVAAWVTVPFRFTTKKK